MSLRYTTLLNKEDFNQKMEFETDLIRELEEKAKIIRKETLELAIKYKEGHIASAYSIVEVLTVLYFNLMKNSDKLILSKGHGCLSLYTCLKMKGFNPVIAGHPDIDEKEGISCTTGSLGHGLPIGMGMAFAKKFQTQEGQIYVIIGDGECQEGTIWESMNLAKKYKLDNLTIIVDFNQLQGLNSVKEIMGETDLKSKFEAFGGDVSEISGHNFHEIIKCFNQKERNKDKPKVIIINTIKGKGLSFMENAPVWHNKIPENTLLEKAYEELK